MWRRFIRLPHKAAFFAAAAGGLATVTVWQYLGSAIDARILGIGPPLAPPLDKLSSLNDLERLGRSRAVILVARGYPAEVATSAIRAFRAAATLLLDRYPGQLVFFVIDDESNAAAANALLTRLGLEHEAPFAVILDRFIETEEKFLMTQRETPDEAQLVSFVSSFVAGKLAPAMLGQPRPPCDRNPDHPALWEVVTDSFEDVVLDPHADVFLEALSPRCSACMACAPRMRILSTFAALHAPCLRVATFNILDNDKPRGCVPDKTTPSFWLFPARRVGTADLQPKEFRTTSVNSSGHCTTKHYCSKHPLRLSGSDQATANDAELPTLPQILEFICNTTDGRITLSESAWAEAARLEDVAQQLELAFSDILKSMDRWHQLNEWARAQPLMDGQAARRFEIAAELRSHISEAYAFIRDEAASDSVPEVQRRLARIQEMFEAARILQQSLA